jgi:aspartyl-tRNA(Asn)/glutamyl-tRNA(Gln) amidotransferase subunit A
MKSLSIREAAAAIAAQSTTAQSLLESAHAAAQSSADLNAIAHVDWDVAREQARALDAEARAGRLRGPLHGVPVTIKDLFNVAGMPTRAGTRATLNELPEGEAGLVRRLRAAGALVFAKTNMHEIALGATGENVWTGDVKNPCDPARQAGGSSSGAGVAVARGIGLGAVGSDTGGSVRIPAAFCGVTGYKPSYGAIPLDGALYLSWTCDHAGPLARSVDDCALLFEAMSLQSTRHGSVPRTPRFAVPSQWLAPRMSDAVRERFERALETLRARGAVVEEVATPMLVDAWRCYTPIARAEGAFVHRAVLAAGGEGLSELVLPPLREGLKLSAAQYLEALRERGAVREALDALLADFDAMLLPTSPVLPPLRGEAEVEVASGLKMPTREAVLGQTAAFSLVGLPTLAMPMGNVGALPTSLQVVGSRDADARLLALGGWIEAALGVV